MRHRYFKKIIVNSLLFTTSLPLVLTSCSKKTKSDDNKIIHHYFDFSPKLINYDGTEDEHNITSLVHAKNLLNTNGLNDNFLNALDQASENLSFYKKTNNEKYNSKMVDITPSLGQMEVYYLNGDCRNVRKEITFIVNEQMLEKINTIGDINKMIRVQSFDKQLITDNGKTMLKLLTNEIDDCISFWTIENGVETKIKKNEDVKKIQKIKINFSNKIPTNLNSNGFGGFLVTFDTFEVNKPTTIVIKLVNKEEYKFFGDKDFYNIELKNIFNNTLFVDKVGNESLGEYINKNWLVSENEEDWPNGMNFFSVFCIKKNVRNLIDRDKENLKLEKQIEYLKCSIEQYDKNKKELISCYLAKLAGKNYKDWDNFIKQFNDQKWKENEKDTKELISCYLAWLAHENYVNWDDFVEQFNDLNWIKKEENQLAIQNLANLLNCQDWKLSPEKIDELNEETINEAKRLINEYQKPIKELKSQINEREGKLPTLNKGDKDYDKVKNELISCYIARLADKKYIDWENFITQFDNKEWKENGKRQPTINSLIRLLNCSVDELNANKINDLGTKIINEAKRLINEYLEPIKKLKKQIKKLEDNIDWHKKNIPIIKKLSAQLNCSIEDVNANKINSLGKETIDNAQEFIRVYQNNLESLTKKIKDLENIDYQCEEDKKELIALHLSQLQLRDENYVNWESFIKQFDDQEWKESDKNKHIIECLTTLLNCTITELSSGKINGLDKKIIKKAQNLKWQLKSSPFDNFPIKKRQYYDNLSKYYCFKEKDHYWKNLKNTRERCLLWYKYNTIDVVGENNNTDDILLYQKYKDKECSYHLHFYSFFKFINEFNNHFSDPLEIIVKVIDKNNNEINIWANGNKPKFMSIENRFKKGDTSYEKINDNFCRYYNVSIPSISNINKNHTNEKQYPFYLVFTLKYKGVVFCDHKIEIRYINN